MSRARIDAALAQGLLPAPGAARVLIVGAGPGHPLCAQYPSARFVQPVQPAHDRMVAAGLDVVPGMDNAGDGFDVAVIALPRARALAHGWIAAATARVVRGGTVSVDGAKTDGVDSLFRALRSRLDAVETLTKAHGRIFAGRAGDDRLADLAPGDMQPVPGFRTGPGMFSADGIDPGSAALAAALPADLGGSVADLGAGWGWLSAQVLSHDKVTALHMVEADHAALQAARANVADPRAQTHWADATAWRPPTALDAIVMNPPFHSGRAADPALGQGFIAAAAQMLSPRGGVWLVANRHLPYETTLESHFAEWRMVDSPPGFKILHANRPRTARKGARP